MSTDFAPELEDRLVRYCAIDTQSDHTSATTPSTAIQLDLSRMLVDELTAMGAADVTLTDYGVVLATVPGTAEGPTIGFCAHVDTAPQFFAEGVKPRVHRNYDGGAITYPDAPDLVLSPEGSPYLGTKTGDTIITASGATLLGADDKSGVAVIMTMAQHLLETPEIPHGPVRIAFTPDEEIGRGVHARLPGDFACDFAYTLDGGERGELDFESFSADGAVIDIEGVSIHPGTAKDKLVNALHLASEIVHRLPGEGMTPETTDGRDGFIMVTGMEGNAARARIELILRDFEMAGLEAKGAIVRETCDAVAAEQPRARVSCRISKQYRNMRYWLDDDMSPVDLARAAYRAEGIEPLSDPIRGGTDGSRLTEEGVPCPNIFTGQQDLHGPLEWISVSDMVASTNVCLRIVRLAPEQTG